MATQHAVDPISRLQNHKVASAPASKQVDYRHERLLQKVLRNLDIILPRYNVSVVFFCTDCFMKPRPLPISSEERFVVVAKSHSPDHSFESACSITAFWGPKPPSIISAVPL